MRNAKALHRCRLSDVRNGASFGWESPNLEGEFEGVELEEEESASISNSTASEDEDEEAFDEDRDRDWDRLRRAGEVQSACTINAIARSVAVSRHMCDSLGVL